MKIIRAILLSLISMVLLNPMVAHAVTLASPDSYDITAVTVYSPALETNDQLYVIQGFVNYTVLPATDAGQAWLIRLKNSGGNETASTTIYPYYNSGYNAPFVASIYLPASLALAWSGNYSITLEPNPTLSWTSIPTAKIFTSFVWSSASTLSAVSTAITAQIRGITLGLNISWSATANPLISYVSGILKFTARGEAYFDGAIPILRTIAPDLYTAALNAPIIVDHNYGNTYQQQVDANLVGTPLDPTNLASDWGLSRMWMTGLLWFLFAILICGLIAYYAQTTKPTFFLFGGLMIAGSFMGFGLLQGILFGLLGGGSLILAFAWRGA